MSTDASEERMRKASMQEAWPTARLAVIQAVGVTIALLLSPNRHSLEGVLPWRASWLVPCASHLLLLVIWAGLVVFRASPKAHAAVRATCRFLLIPTILTAGLAFVVTSGEMWEPVFASLVFYGQILACIGVCLIPFAAFETKEMEALYRREGKPEES